MSATTTLASKDGTRLRMLRWDPQGEPVGKVLIVHGFAEHMGRYEHVAGALTARGWTVFGLELRGHGASEGERGHILHWSDYADDVDAALAEIADPAFVLCHSMGGLVMSWHGIERQRPQIQGVVFTNPLMGTAFEPARLKVMAGRLLSKLAPGVDLPGEVDPQNICRDPAVVDAYVNDPLVFTTMNARWAMEVLAAQRLIHERAQDFKHPVLLLVSDGDKICSAERSKAWLSQVGSPDSSLQEFGPLYHELMNEPEKQQVLDSICDWLEAHRA